MNLFRTAVAHLPGKALLLTLGMTALLATSLPAQTRVDLLPYAMHIKYNDTAYKEYGMVGGLYGYFGQGLSHTWEGDIGFTRMNFGEFADTVGTRRIITTPINVDQWDATLVYSNYSILNTKLRVGTHAIVSDDTLTDKSLVLFGGVNHYRSGYYNAGVDLYHTWYDNYLPGLKVLQVTATFGFFFGNYITYGSFYAETRGHYIKHSQDVGFGETRFPSVEQSLFFYRNRLTLEAFLWSGYQAFGVMKDGFAVYNIAEKHLGGFGGSVRYNTSPKSSLKLSFSQGRFNEVGSGQISRSLSVMVLLGYTF
ncbi:MAG TPA: hypothetical protein PKV71_03185 [Calditrichia bacterium]|nr:hypothetical protein [Calditrichia bacterium]